MDKPLSVVQRRLYDLLNATPDTDVPIIDLYRKAYPDAPGFKDADAPLAVRHMQQSIGPIIARINDKIVHTVRPGDMKRTYRLDTQG